MSLIKLCLAAVLLCACAPVPPGATEQARISACLAASKLQTQRDKQACRELRADCLDQELGQFYCTQHACNLEQIAAIFDAANERELECLEAH